MATEVEAPAKEGAIRKQRQPIIDVDVHERLVSHRDLALYLEEPWRHYVTNTSWQGPRQLPYVQLMSAGVDRADAIPEEGGPAGSSVSLLQKQLLDEWNVEVAILTGLFYPSTLKAQFEFATALATAYNNWQIEHWLDKDQRLRGSIHVAAQDPASAVREIDRLGSHPQMVQILLPIDSTWQWGDPFYHPIFEAANRHGLHVAMHISTAARTAVDIPRYFIEWHTCYPQAFMSQATSVICNGIFDKWPELKLVLLECSFTWVPHLMWRMDTNYRSLRMEVPWMKRMPSEYFHENVRCATQPMEEPDPKHLLQCVEMIGNDEFLLFATDYPHWDFDSPHRAFPHTFSKELKQKILYGNAKKLYGF
jgi:uncharacterized protein